MEADSLYIGTDPIWTVLIRFGINITVLFIVIRLIYYNFSKKAEDLFTFYLMGVMIFMICIMLQAVDIKMGMALGLFAVFAILRFRTSNFSGKSMAYFFAIIGISTINALVNFHHVLIGTFIANSIIILTILILELYLKKRTFSKHQVIYDRIDLLNPDSIEELLADLSQRTKKKIERVEIKEIDLIKHHAELDVFYLDVKSNKQISK